MEPQAITPEAGVQKNVAPIAPGRCDGLMPEFVRPVDAVKLFGIGKSTLADWIRQGWIRSHNVRRQGCIKGMRLVSTASLRKFIENHHQEAA